VNAADSAIARSAVARHGRWLQYVTPYGTYSRICST
jgi:hypothetical protein